MDWNWNYFSSFMFIIICYGIFNWNLCAVSSSYGEDMMKILTILLRAYETFIDEKTEIAVIQWSCICAEAVIIICLLAEVSK